LTAGAFSERVGQRLSRMVLEPRWVILALLDANAWRRQLLLLGVEGLQADDFLAVRVCRNKNGENPSLDFARSV
jgi:hypothetical protein